jgi:hypothetical protein
MDMNSLLLCLFLWLITLPYPIFKIFIKQSINFIIIILIFFGWKYEVEVLKTIINGMLLYEPLQYPYENIIL